MGDQYYHPVLRGKKNNSFCAMLVIMILVVLSVENCRAARFERWESAIRMPTDKDEYSDQDKELGTRWAVLVAGSSGYGNYRHQADVCHAYQLLRKGGVKEENIVVFMYDDIAMHELNPRPGIIINHPQGDDVYAGVPKPNQGFKKNFPFSQSPSGNSVSRGHFQHQPQFQHPSRGGRFPGRGRGRGRFWTSNKPQCQLCGRIGHIVLDCYYRFDHSFQGPSQVQNNSRPSFPSAAHVATVSNPTPAPALAPVQVMAATAETVTDSSWYPDSGASNHVTSEASNLMQMKDYFGPEQVYIGNGFQNCASGGES